MKTLTRDDTKHGKEYVLKSEADAIEAERAALWTRCRDIEAKLLTQQAISAELRTEVQQLKLGEEGAAKPSATLCKTSATLRERWSACNPC